MVYIENITTSQQVYIPRQTVNTGSSQNCGCINLEDYYTRSETDALISTLTGVSKEYVDTQDEATLQSAKDYTDQAIAGIDFSKYATVAQLDAAIQAELERATTAEMSLKDRIDNLFDWRTNTLYLNNE